MTKEETQKEEHNQVIYLNMLSLVVLMMVLICGISKAMSCWNFNLIWLLSRITKCLSKVWLSAYGCIFCCCSSLSLAEAFHGFIIKLIFISLDTILRFACGHKPRSCKTNENELNMKPMKISAEETMAAPGITLQLTFISFEICTQLPMLS